MPSQPEETAYQTALWKIATCRRKGRKRLDLSGLGLDEPPPEIGRLHALGSFEPQQDREIAQ